MTRHDMSGQWTGCPATRLATSCKPAKFRSRAVAPRLLFFRSIMRQPTDDGEGFSALEEAFFREGDAMSANEVVEHITEVAEPPQRSGWSRWFARTPRAATAGG